MASTLLHKKKTMMDKKSMILALYTQVQEAENKSEKEKEMIIIMCMLSHIRLFATPWTVAHHTPLSMGFPRWEYWSELSFPSPRDLPDL